MAISMGGYYYYCCYLHYIRTPWGFRSMLEAAQLLLQRLRNETVFDNGRGIRLGADQMSWLCQLLSWWVVLQVAELAPKNFWMNKVYHVSEHGILISNSAFRVKLHLLVCCFEDWFLLIFLPGVSSNHMQRSKSLCTAHVASEKFCRSLQSQKWLPFFEYGFQEFTFENYKCLCNLWNESGIWKWHFPSSFSSQGLSSLFKVFLPFLQKKIEMVHPCCKDMWELPDCITTGTVLSTEARSQKSWGAALVFGCPLPTLGSFFTSKDKYRWLPWGKKTQKNIVFLCGIWPNTSLTYV